MNAIWNDIKSNFKNGNNYTRLLYINIGFFLVYKILTIFSVLFIIENNSDFVHNYLALPSEPNTEPEAPNVIPKFPIKSCVIPAKIPVNV